MWSLVLLVLAVLFNKSAVAGDLQDQIDDLRADVNMLQSEASALWNEMDQAISPKGFSTVYCVSIEHCNNANLTIYLYNVHFQ